MTHIIASLILWMTPHPAVYPYQPPTPGPCGGKICAPLPRPVMGR
jgi:hypothetical protein